jgi:hypothetical protein
MRVTLEEFERRLAEHKGPLPARLMTRTRPKLLVKGRVDKLPCPWKQGVEHVISRRVVLGERYEDCVNAQRYAEGNTEPFKASALWPSREYPDGAGERDSEYTVRHKGSGKRYLAVRLDPEDYEMFATWDFWYDLHTGANIDPRDLEQYLPPRSASESEVAWRTIDLEHIDRCDIDHCDDFEIVRSLQAAG